MEWSGASGWEGKVCMREEQKVGSQSGGGRAGLVCTLPPFSSPSLHCAMPYCDLRVMRKVRVLSHMAELGVHEETPWGWGAVAGLS